MSENFFWKTWIDHAGNACVGRDIVKALLNDLTGRRGLRQEFEAIDEDVQREIIFTWIGIAEKILAEKELE